MNTAQHREEARKAEKALQWDKAAYHWQMAIDLYPPDLSGRPSAIARLDIDNMTKRRIACQTSHGDKWTEWTARTRVGGTFGS